MILFIWQLKDWLAGAFSQLVTIGREIRQEQEVLRLQVEAEAQASERRFEQLLYRLDKLDEAALAASQATLLMVEMLEAKKKPVRKKTGEQQREGSEP